MFSGDSNTLRRTCCTGLANSLNGRIAARPKGEKITWSLDKYIRSPSTWFTGIRVVSDRAVQLPELPDSGIRQVVLRITSRQSSGKMPRHIGRNSRPGAAETPVKQQNCTEYLVLQKLRWMSQDEGWRIWGHATPTTVEDLSTPMFAPGLSVNERIEAMQASFGIKK